MSMRELSDAGVVDELRARVRRERLQRNVTQADLADRAGIGLHTLRRFEAGQGEPSLSSFVAILRALDGITALEAVLPEPSVDPLASPAQPDRQRSSATRSPATWTWGDER